MKIPESVLMGVVAAALAGCAPAADVPPASVTEATAGLAAPAGAASAPTAEFPAAPEDAGDGATSKSKPTATTSALPVVLVHKSPTCGCCNGWVEHLRHAGFMVTVDERDDLSALKQQLGIPADKASCHTAEVDGLVIEGHVPAADIKRLLAERGDARGLVLPGMPVGSPGMESPDGRVQAYTVERLASDVRTPPYAHHDGAQ
jgi:hypothetical protein